MSDKYHYLKTEYEHEWSKRDLFFLDKAFYNAFFSDFTSSLKLGACLAINKKKFYTGYNQKSRTQIFKSKYVSLHAEIHALSNFIKQEYGKYNINCGEDKFNNLTVYVIRLMNNPQIPPYGISKPCKRCESFLYEHNIKYIKYTDVDKFGKQILITLQRN